MPQRSKLAICRREYGHLEQTRTERDAVLRGLFERASYAREFRSSIARDAGRVREQARDRPLGFPRSEPHTNVLSARHPVTSVS